MSARRAGPGGVQVAWEAVLTKRVLNQEIAWETQPGSTVEHLGHVLFLPTESGGTRIDVHLSYAPPAAAVGHSIACLFGADPKAEIDADLARETPRGAGDHGPLPSVRPSMVKTAGERDSLNATGGRWTAR